MTEPTTAKIRLLGDPALRVVSRPIEDFNDPEFRANARLLQRTLADFRRRHGFGRAVSAPQIGVAQRFIAIDLGDGPALVVNPEIIWQSGRRFTMWDDCMSFPDLLVRLERDASLSLRFQDERGDFREWTELDLPTAELLQHEIDHLDGVLAVDRALDRDALVLRENFTADYEYYKKQVDYVIY